MDTVTESKNIYQRISIARQYVANLQSKKGGKNTYSNYDYFTPEQVESITFQACFKAGLEIFHQLKHDNYGYYGELTIVNPDNPEETLTLVDRTAFAKLKAANDAQCVGGTKTYSHRYMLTNLFYINTERVDIDKLAPNNTISEGQIKQLTDFVKTGVMASPTAKQIIAKYGFNSSAEITTDAFSAILENFRAYYKESKTNHVIKK